MIKEIGWSNTSNLLYQLGKKYQGKNGNIPQEIGWGQEDKLIQETILEVPCSPCVPGESTTSTTTTALPT
jgi:hypothetical protein